MDKRKRTGADHPSYGIRHIARSKALMSAAKKGSKHPKFKGWYVVNGRKFDTPTDAHKYTGINPKSVYRWCKALKNDCYFLDNEKLKDHKSTAL